MLTKQHLTLLSKKIGPNIDTLKIHSQHPPVFSAGDFRLTGTSYRSSLFYSALQTGCRAASWNYRKIITSSVTARNILHPENATQGAPQWLSW